jgi:hypothetical protein
MSESFLSACKKESSFDIFVDGHKSISRYVALKAGGFPLRGVIHLVRDPRAFAASSKRATEVPVHASARQWINLHRTINRVTRWCRERVYTLRYEDLCASPREELTRLQNWLGASPEMLLRPVDPRLHWLGNGSMRSFTGEIRNSEKWKSELTGRERSCVENLTYRLAATYRYDFA